MLKKFIVVLFFLLVGGIYLHSLTRDIYSGDVGDLVTAAVIHGVAHPPGYPLFTLFGFLFSKLPLPLPPVSKIGLISLFASISGLIFIYFFAKKVTKSVFLSLLSTSILAFSYLFWLHAELPEVFALNNFFAIVIIYFAIRFYERNKLLDFYILTFVTALSLTHHHTILLIFPAVGLLVIRRIKVLLKNKKTISAIIILTIIGILPYLYIPIAASTNPVVNWDNAVTLDNFIRLLLRKDYGGFAPSVFNGVPTVVKTILAKDFLKTIASLYSYQVIFVAVLGIVALFKKDKWFLFSLLLTFLLAGPIFIFYSASLITTTTAWGVNERFYLLASVVFIFFVPYGFSLLKQIIEKKVSNPVFTYILLSYFLIIPFFLIKANFRRTDLSKTQIGNNLARDIITYLPKNAVLFVAGDTTTFNLWYVRYVLARRTDVDIVNPGGVGGNNFLDREINQYYLENPKTRLDELVRKTLESIGKKRKVFATFDINIKVNGAKFIPKGLIYELISDQEIMKKEEYLKQVEELWRKMHVVRRESLSLAEQNLMSPEIPLIYSNGFIRIADYLASNYADPAKAEHYYRRAMWIDPSNPAAYAGLGLSLYNAYKDCKESVNQMKEAISRYQIWKRYYLQLFVLYDRCKVEEKAKKELVELYKKRFNENLVKKVKEQSIQ